MSDLPPPPEPEPPVAPRPANVPPVPPDDTPLDANGSGEPPKGGEPSSFWDRYRSLPTWAQIIIPIVIVAILIGLWFALTNDSDEASSADTSVPQDSNFDEVLTGIIIAGGIRADDAATSTEVIAVDSTTIPEALPPTTPATAGPNTSPAPDTAAAPIPPPAAPDTTAAQAPAPPDTDPSVTEPPTTEPPTTEGPSGVLPAPEAFLAQWNAAADGTDVPTLSRDQVTEIVQGPFAGSFLATLTPTNGSGSEPQVGLIGTMSTSDPTQIAELLLVYVSGPDEGASDFYWEAFGVLAQAVDPSMTNREISDLEDSLGRADGLPPFPDGTNTTTESNGFAYNLSTGSTQEGTPATAISVS